ncbi:hypothetical protein HYR99_19630 [Candidatus Poribacteria bacterium]|nr:hypothetical protein [Candidatus Poribacteria bacterium]
MYQKRTQIYLRPDQHESLKAEAQMLKISLAELMRRIVEEHLKTPNKLSLFAKEDYLSIVGLGESGIHDIAEQHNHYLGVATAADYSD